jgi:hypothetical protein
MPSSQTDGAVIRARLAELGRACIEEAANRDAIKASRSKERTPVEEGLYQLSRAPREPVRAAIDQALKNGTTEERIGALTLYNWIAESSGTYFPKEPLNPSYRTLLLDLLARDDGTTPAYTNSLVTVLLSYPSPETVSMLMRLSTNSKEPDRRTHYAQVAAYLLRIELPITTQTGTLEKQQIVANFQAWYEQNKDRIRFDSEGNPSVKGVNPNAKPRALTTEERARIRKDPVCILELLEGSSGGIAITEEEVKKLTERCGEALYGAEGMRLLKEMTAKAEQTGLPAYDLSMNLAAARAKYPMLDAALLAVAYVAADDADPKHRELARNTFDDLGMPPDDIVRVLKREDKVVRGKLVELTAVDQTN